MVILRGTGAAQGAAGAGCRDPRPALLGLSSTEIRSRDFEADVRRLCCQGEDSGASSGPAPHPGHLLGQSDGDFSSQLRPQAHLAGVSGTRNRAFLSALGEAWPACSVGPQRPPGARVSKAWPPAGAAAGRWGPCRRWDHWKEVRSPGTLGRACWGPGSFPLFLCFLATER